MSEPIRLVATDLDGTLMRSDGTVSNRTRDALAAAEAAGILIVLVTGRPPRWMGMVAERTGHHGVAVCSNGAVIYDLAKEQVLATDPVPALVGAAVISAIRQAIPEARFAAEHRSGNGFAYESGWLVKTDPGVDLDDGGRRMVRTAEELVAEPVSKLLARHDGADADTMLAAARAAVGDVVTITHSSRFGLIEISAAGVSKATGLERLAAGHGVTATEVVAFGDMPNDLPMLAWAGRPVAVANAHPAVLSAAGEVTLSNDEDGVALVIEQILASGRNGRPARA